MGIVARALQVIDLQGVLLSFKNVEAAEALSEVTRFENDAVVFHQTSEERPDLYYNLRYSSGLLLMGDEWEVVFKNLCLSLDSDVNYEDDDICLVIPRHLVRKIRVPFSLEATMRIFSDYFKQIFKRTPTFEPFIPVSGLEGMSWEYVLEQNPAALSGDQLYELVSAITAVRGIRFYYGVYSIWGK